MKEIEMLLKAFADGLKSMAQGINTLAGRVDQMAQEQFGDKTAKPEAQKKAESKKAQRRPAGTGKKVKTSKADVPVNMAETVLQALRHSGQPMSNAALAEKTGFDRKQISSVLSKLKKRGMIKSVDKGLHTAQ